ncbi:hypothetical protein, partial [Streptococcus pyogenes]|uniref:hypothetical protein n=1 Tax=Streptococcus pyogenes TaxID=1314 RepID=UPI003DA181BB
LCINGTDGTIVYEKHRFEVVVTEPEPLDVLVRTAPNGKQVMLTLEGADSYNIELNGDLMQTGDSELSLPLKIGSNQI